MAGRLDLLLEADRRGILPPQQSAYLAEARRRGLVPGGQAGAPMGGPSERSPFATSLADLSPDAKAAFRAWAVANPDRAGAALTGLLAPVRPGLPTGYMPSGGGVKLLPGLLEGETAKTAAEAEAKARAKARYPKLPTGTYMQDGKLMPVPGLLDFERQKTETGWKPLDRIQAETQAGWKPLDRVRAEAAAGREKWKPFYNKAGDPIGERSSDGKTRFYPTYSVSPDEEVRGVGGGLLASGRPKTYAARTFMVPDGKGGEFNALSYDRGLTYMDPKTRRPVPMPPTAYEIGEDTAGEYITGQRAIADARRALEEPPPDAGISAETAARGQEIGSAGTGFWARARSFFDAVAGGIWGGKAMFPETADNKQTLRLIRQRGYSAFKNSARGAVYDQAQVYALYPDPDSLWTNPDVEARKVPKLVQELQLALRANQEEIASGLLPPKRRQELNSNSLELKRMIDRMSGGSAGPTSGSTLSSEDEALIRKYSK